MQNLDICHRETEDMVKKELGKIKHDLQPHQFSGPNNLHKVLLHQLLGKNINWYDNDIVQLIEGLRNILDVKAAAIIPADSIQISGMFDWHVTCQAFASLTECNIAVWTEGNNDVTPICNREADGGWFNIRVKEVDGDVKFESLVHNVKK